MLDAVHQLFCDGHLDPAAEEVAARSGVSLRSIYRYFPDREQLLLAALQRRLADAEHLFAVPDAGEGSLEDRVAVYVRHRLELHALMAPTARVTLVAARHMPALAAVIAERRRQLHDLALAQFAPELGSLADDQRDDTALAIDVFCQFESIEALREARGGDDDRVAGLLRAGVLALLAVRG